MKKRENKTIKRKWSHKIQNIHQVMLNFMIGLKTKFKEGQRSNIFMIKKQL